MEARRELLLLARAAYNSQDADVLLELVSDDVEWPNDSTGRLHGKAEVRARWTEQWSRTRPHDEPARKEPNDQSDIKPVDSG
ncbi:nuclear transport factor 2 family protein [Saccharothrix sp. ST-888]|uniref:nuclear transport factor 2 family protein n=1 Tax=Saccharothrix sp. ST-888 TaxID=1427391 RepID=UPI0006983B72|nr:nuclear transport factor 2 family protein [Saccharothrix sp. ST-888]